MPTVITCDQCRKSYQVKDEWAGLRVRCPGCAATIHVPVAASRAPAVPPPAAAGMPAPPTPPAAGRPAPATGRPAPAAASRAAVAKVPATPERILALVLTGFQGELPEKKVSPLYMAGLVFTSLVMIVLPIIYVALIGLVCWGVYWHLVNDTGMLTATTNGRAAIFLLLTYLTPPAIGAILIAFMIKPFFAAAGNEGRRRSLKRQNEPVLFGLVDKICEIVDAPAPRRIDINCDVNASASFRRGLWSAVVGNDLVLTIGMPLAAGLSLEQFAGVLAHEFGHFSQGAGMRLTYVVRSINFWFVRVVYQRDAWDLWLAGAASGLDIRIGWVLYLARFCVWLTRWVLWLLMMIGHLTAGFMLRQMEFDADSCEARLVGSTVFEATARKLQLLNVAYGGAQTDAQEFYREGRLADDLPRLMIANIGQIPKPVRAKIDEAIATRKTGLLDSHPADKDRIAAAQEFGDTGIFHCKLPTNCLFSDFAATTRNVTYDFYCMVLGNKIKQEDLHPVDALLSRQNKDQQADEALTRFFGGKLHMLRPWPLPKQELHPPKDLALARKQLDTARRKMLAAHTGYQATFSDFDASDTRHLQAQQIGMLLAAKVRVKPAHFKCSFRSQDACRQAANLARQEQSQWVAALEAFETAAGFRLYLALALLYDDAMAAKIDDVEKKQEFCEDLFPLAARFAQHGAAILAMRNDLAVLGALCAHLEGNENNHELIRSIRDALRSLHTRVIGMMETFGHLPYPFEHAKGSILLTEFLLEKMPPKDDLGATYQAAETLLENLSTVFARAVSHLCLIAEEVEKTVGLGAVEYAEGIQEEKES